MGGLRVDRRMRESLPSASLGARLVRSDEELRSPRVCAQLKSRPPRGHPYSIPRNATWRRLGASGPVRGPSGITCSLWSPWRAARHRLEVLERRPDGGSRDLPSSVHARAMRQQSEAGQDATAGEGWIGDHDATGATLSGDRRYAAGTSRAALRPRASLVPKRIDGVEARRLSRRIEAEEHADGPREEKRRNDGVRLDRRRPAREVADGPGAQDPENDTH